MVPHLMRSLASLLGYFNMANTPAVRLLRSNFVSLISLVLCMGGLLVGVETMSASLLCLMMLNLFDVFTAATVDHNSSPEPVQEVVLSTQD